MMDGLVQAATTLLPLSLKEGGFEDPANMNPIEESLRAMRGHATMLEDYAWGEDEGFVWLAASLGRDIDDAGRAFERNRHDEARFRVQRLTVNCVACHSRLPAATSSNLGDRLFEAIDVTSLHPDELAQLQQATRQFEGAASTYEAMLSERPEDKNISRIWCFVDYLVLTIRVMGDLERPKVALKPYVDAPELPGFVRRDTTAWLASLNELSPTVLSEQTTRENKLERSRLLIQRAKASTGSPSGRQGLIYWIVASSLLNQYVQGHPERSADLAEAYYLLGLAEAQIGHSPWLSQTEYYLEAAVRSAPSTKAASDALALLEWHLAVEYTGSGGEHIPPESRALLEQLRGLIDRAQ